MAREPDHRDEVASTLQAGDQAGAVEPAETPEVLPPDWQRYTDIRFLGAGAMGQVFRAWDPRLKREVALKVLTRERPGAMARFAREAQAQARVDHPHVCKVYDVGEVGGRPYIAMQLVAGEPLGAIGEQMSVREQVEVVRRVVEAVQAAHEAQLIHRDLKPGNILVERRGTGWHPYVVDFGLVRELSDSGATMTGDVLGTPQYMAPEQARGSREVDARSDVYGLGATLYRILAGRPPYLGSPAEVLARAIEGEPPSLSSVAGQVPADLQVIVMKCLERDPARRYQSARELADDLGRFLAGEPIVARRAGVGRRLGRTVRRHPALVSSLAVLLIAAAVGGVLWNRARREAAARELAAQRFGSEAEKIDGIVRQAYTLPLHDTRGELARVRERMAWIRMEAERIGRGAEGPAAFALGRGHLALREYDQARRELERAWELGQRSHELSFALGVTMAQLYARERRRIAALPDGPTRRQREAEIIAGFREPALQRLQEARDGPFAAPAFIEALIAVTEGRHADGAARAREAAAQVPWLYEARVLEAEAIERDVEPQMRSGKLDESLAGLERIGAALEAAADIGRSDPVVHDRMCGRWVRTMDIHYNMGRPVRDLFRAAMAACDASAAADPDRPEPYRKKSQVLAVRAMETVDGGGDPVPDLAQSIALARHATELAPDVADAWNDLGLSLKQHASYLADHGRPFDDVFARSEQAIERAIQLEPRIYLFHSNLGLLLDTWAWYLIEQGRDPRPLLDRAGDAFRRGLAIEPGAALLHGNLANALATRGDWMVSRGQDPRAFYRQAIASYRTASASDPSNFRYPSNRASTHVTLARAEDAAGSDPLPEVQAAIDAAGQSLALNPRYYYAHMFRGAAGLVGAGHAIDRGQDPARWLDDAQRDLDRTLELNPQQSDAMYSRAELEILRARWLRARRKATGPALDAAAGWLARAVATGGDAPEAHQQTAQAHLLRAEWAIADRAPPGAHIQAGLAAAARALQMSPELAPVRLLRAELNLLAAKTGSGEAVAAARARADLEWLKGHAPLLGRRAAALAQRIDGP